MHFDCRLRSQLHMLTQGDIRESATAQQTLSSIIAQYLIERALHGDAPCATRCSGGISFRFSFPFLELHWKTIESEGISREYTSSQSRMFP